MANTRRRVKKKNKHIVFYHIIAILLIIATTICIQQHRDKVKYEALLDEQKAEYELFIQDMVIEHQDEMGKLRMEYEQLTPEELIQQEAEFIAKALYGFAKDHSERDQRTGVWCILNRVDHPNYPNSVQAVCQQDEQWIGYSDNNPVLTNLYELAVTELETWHNNYRPVSAEYVFMSWSSKEIVLRNTYKTTSATKHWRAG